MKSPQEIAPEATTRPSTMKYLVLSTLTLLAALQTLSFLLGNLHTLLDPMSPLPLHPTAAVPDTSHHPPLLTPLNNLTALLSPSADGVYGFIFDSSRAPPDVPYGTYNWCNMPHVRRGEYEVVGGDVGVLRYVEVVQRHHKRTPYRANLVPGEEEGGGWEGECVVFGADGDDAKGSVKRCDFPQLTLAGLEDAWQHGRDLHAVYHDLLHLLPSASTDLEAFKGATSFRVTNNPITTQVAHALLSGMLSPASNFSASEPAPSIPLLKGSPETDSLEPRYDCPAARALYASYAVGSKARSWTAHLAASRRLFAELDAITGVDPSSEEWHRSADHYFDNLSARLAHGKPLPCAAGACVTRAQADAIFRLGEYEYSYIHRDAPESLAASAASFGVWVAELAAQLKGVAQGRAGGKVYRHNVAHDGSLARLLGILQVEEMVWPGMGSEVVFELYQGVLQEGWFVRILWGGRVLRSSSPTLQADARGLLPLRDVTGYIDGLVGVDASLVPHLCSLT